MAALAAELTRIRGPAAGAGPCAARLCSGHLAGHSRAARLRSGHLVGHSPLASGRLDARWLVSHWLITHWLASHRLTSRRLASHPRHSGISGHLARGLVHLHLLHVGVGCRAHEAAAYLHSHPHAHKAGHSSAVVGSRVFEPLRNGGLYVTLPD